MRIDAYRNLQRDCISVKSREPDTRGRVIDHADEVRIRDAEFVVQPAGRQRVLDENRKNVHAFVRGVRDDDATLPESPGYDVTYNPYEHDSFVECNSPREITRASLAVVTPAGVRAYNPIFTTP